jgi:tRNA pseudouridine55 synthase
VLGLRRVGHTGTLDPFASGVLPVCIGKATRLVRFLSGHDKAYEATVRFGFATTTDDHQGEPLAPAVPVALTRARVEEAAAGLVGEILQTPPAYSAKRTGGRRHYEIARAGETVERRPCRITVHSLELTRLDGDTADIRVTCSAGTYIRAVARDLGERLGVGGHLTALRRTRSGPFDIVQALALPALEREAAVQRLIPLGGLMLEMPAVYVDAPGREALRHGRALDRTLVASGFPESPAERLRVLDHSGALLALAVPRGFGPKIAGLPVEPVLQPDLVLID